MPAKQKKVVIPDSVRDTIRRRVRKGAAALDATKPNWRKKVKADFLQMENSDQCILGQVYGRYWKGVNKTFKVHEESERYDRLSISHGFNLGFVDTDAVVEKLVAANCKPNARRAKREEVEDGLKPLAWDLLHKAWVKELANN